MRRLIITLITVCAYTLAYAQQLSVKAVSLRPQDARASTNPREDANGKKCAIIRVGVVGMDDMVFPDAIGNVERSLSEYIVYVSEGLKTFKYNTTTGTNLGEIVFDDWGMEINSLASYDVILESDSHLRSAIFAIHPKNAQFVFNGEKINVDGDGMVMINKPIGEYAYQVTADGFEAQSGTVSLTEDDISTVTDVVLQEILYPVNVKVFPEDATVFIDNVPYSKEARSDLQLPCGKHSFRVTATDYEDYEQTIEVKDGLSPISFVLKESKQEVVKHKEERTRTNISIRNAFYITAGFSLTGAADIGKIFSSENALDFGAEFSATQHFAGIFGLREGIGLYVIKPNGNEKYFDMSVYNDSTRYLMHIDIPLQISVSVPFGAYNRHLFTVFAGGYGSYIWRIDDWREKKLNEEEKEKIATADKKDKEYFDYGLRISAKIDIGHFTMGVDLSQSLHKMGFSAGANLGWKLYSLKKKK